MGIPIIERLIQCQGQFVQVFKPATFQGQGTELLPPRFNQIEPAGILGDKLQLDFRPSCQSEFHRSAEVDGQVILDDQPAIGRKGDHDLLQQLDVAGTVAPWAKQGYRLSGGGLKPTMHPQFAAPPIIWLKGRPVG